MVPRRIQRSPLKLTRRGLLVSTEDGDELAPLYRLLMLGFLTHACQGVNGPTAIMCARQRMDLYDTVRVHGPDLCEAARVVGNRVTKKTSGRLADVVIEVEGWPMVLTATGKDIA